MKGEVIKGKDGKENPNAVKYILRLALVSHLQSAPVTITWTWCAGRTGRPTTTSATPPARGSRSRSSDTATDLKEMDTDARIWIWIPGQWLYFCLLDTE